MANDKASITKTILVVLLVSLVCSIIVAGSAVLLKDKQQEQVALDKQKNILRVAGLTADAATINAVFASRIETKVVDLDSGDFVTSAADFDLSKALKDQQQSIALAASEDLAGIRRRANWAEVYLVKDEAGKLEKVVLPIYGNGLWSVMYGFVAVRPDGNSIDGIAYYQHGETPGLGGEIENPKWQAHFVGKQLYDAKGAPAITIVKSGASATDLHKVDALSGATLTSKGVQHSFDFWFGSKGFEPFLTKLKQGELTND